ncbi:hypothetical protein EBR96_09280, partial [bacterium]|nr:hypothetical protein [bacterium]
FLTKAVSVLGLDDRIKIEQKKDSGIYILTYVHSDPMVSKRVVDLYLLALARMNVDLEIGTKREFVSVIDSAVIPTQSTRPALKLYLLMIIPFIFIISVAVCVLVDKVIADFRAHRG